MAVRMAVGMAGGSDISAPAVDVLNENPSLPALGKKDCATGSPSLSLAPSPAPAPAASPAPAEPRPSPPCAWPNPAPKTFTGKLKDE